MQAQPRIEHDTHTHTQSFLRVVTPDVTVRSATNAKAPRRAPRPTLAPRKSTNNLAFIEPDNGGNAKNKRCHGVEIRNTQI